MDGCYGDGAEFPVIARANEKGVAFLYCTALDRTAANGADGTDVVDFVNLRVEKGILLIDSQEFKIRKYINLNINLRVYFTWNRV